MKIFLCFLFLLLDSVAVLAGQPQKKIEKYLQEVYDHNVMPGFSVVVVKDGKIIFSDGFGVEVLGKEKPFTPLTVTGIGSVTKSLTALAIMQLSEQKKIDIDKPIVFYLPWFRTANKERSDKITVRMLLNHTSGLFGSVTNSNDMSDKSTENLARGLQSVYLTREPGVSYEYSNLGFSMAGLIVSKVSGIPYAEYLQEKIFTPTDMRSTSTDYKVFDKIKTTYGHYPGTDKGIPAGRFVELESGEYIPAGLLTKSSATDLGKYLVMLMHGGVYNGHQIVSQKSIEEMWTSNVFFPGFKKEQGGDGSKSAYGLGWEISAIEGRNMIYHGGSTGTSSSVVMLDTTKKIGVAMLVNLDMTLVDEYKHQGLLNIMNNIMHLAADEPTTNYGVPRIKDPSLNDYVLDKSLQSKYIGDYISLAGGIWMFDGADMTIRENQHGQLEALIKRGQQVIFQFDVDFVNPSSAVSRNVFTPSQMHFKVAPDGSVSSVFFNGSEYIRQNNFLQTSYKTTKSENGYLQFKLPSEWNIKWSGSYFKVYAANYAGPLLEGYLNYSNSVAGSDFIASRLKGYNIRVNGTAQSETIGQLVWKEKTMISEKDGRTWQHLAFSVKSGNHACYLLLTTPQETFMRELQNFITPLLTTFRLNF
ncbi:MAG: beta-lactamase family protein [Bacteroidetes bacterium]|nr:beta-lactamase family protein [Bacteroidota bacterium]